jgi:O-antigen ligase
MRPVLLSKLTSANTSLYLIGSMCCLPFIIPYHNIPIPTFYNEWVAALCGLLGLTALFKSNIWQTLKLPRSSLIFLGLILITNLQSVIDAKNTSPNLPLIQSYLVWAFLLSLLGQYLQHRLGWEKLTLTLARAILIAATVNLGFVVLQALQQAGIAIPITRLQSYGMLAQNNNFADFIALGIISLLYLATKKRIHQHALLIGLFCGLVLLSLSGSRSSVLYLISITFFSWLLHRQLRASPDLEVPTDKLFKISLALLPIFIMIQLVFAKYVPLELTHTPMMRVLEIMHTQASSLRWQFWQTSLYLFQQSPLLGTGAGQMRWQSYLLANNSIANPAHVFFEHAHNMFFNLLAEMGIFAFISVLVGLVFWTKDFFQKNTLQLETWWLLAILSVLGIHSLLEYPLWYSFFLGIFAFLLGAGDAKTLTFNAFSQPVKRLLSLILLLVFVYGFQQLMVMQVAYRTLEKQIAIASQATMTDLQKQHFIEEMLWVNDHTLLAPCAQLVIATFLSPNKTQASNQLPLVESAAKFIPLRKVCLNLIILLEISQRHTEALQHLRRLSQIAGEQLQTDIQQLPPEHIPLLESLLNEIQQENLSN